jgi:hypothetical protein
VSCPAKAGHLVRRDPAISTIVLGIPDRPLSRTMTMVGRRPLVRGLRNESVIESIFVTMALHSRQTFPSNIRPKALSQKNWFIR